MAFDILETHELLEVVETSHQVPSFWLDRYFPSVHLSDSEFIDFDVVDKGKRLAPYVLPHVQGQPMLARRESMRKFKPAYLKPKDPLDPSRVLRRRAGERIGGSMSPQEREDAIVADILTDHEEMIRRRWEYMACEAATKGQITISGENYPTVTVTFGRAAANTVTLVGTARWGQAAADPMANLKAWVATVFRSGRAAVDLILGIDAATAFFSDPKVKDALETRRGSTMALESYVISGEVVTYHGELPGGLRVWTYNDVWEDNMGVEQPFLLPGDVVLIGDIGGVRAFGAIMDKKAGWNALPIFPKMWEQEDPSGLFLMTQSAPLMIPTRPNASFKASVL